MKYLDEYRDAAAARRLLAAISRTARRPWVLMEVCGGQTHSIVKYGIDEFLPGGIELVHGPGCPVCVTSLEMIDRALPRRQAAPHLVAVEAIENVPLQGEKPRIREAGVDRLAHDRQRHGEARFAAPGDGRCLQRSVRGKYRP